MAQGTSAIKLINNIERGDVVETAPPLVLPEFFTESGGGCLFHILRPNALVSLQGEKNKT